VAGILEFRDGSLYRSRRIYRLYAKYVDNSVRGDNRLDTKRYCRNDDDTRQRRTTRVSVKTLQSVNGLNAIVTDNRSPLYTHF